MSGTAVDQHHHHHSPHRLSGCMASLENSVAQYFGNMDSMGHSLHEQSLVLRAQVLSDQRRNAAHSVHGSPAEQLVLSMGAEVNNMVAAANELDRKVSREPELSLEALLGVFHAVHRQNTLLAQQMESRMSSDMNFCPDPDLADEAFADVSMSVSLPSLSTGRSSSGSRHSSGFIGAPLSFSHRSSLSSQSSTQSLAFGASSSDSTSNTAAAMTPSKQSAQSANSTARTPPPEEPTTPKTPSLADFGISSNRAEALARRSIFRDAQPESPEAAVAAAAAPATTTVATARASGTTTTTSTPEKATREVDFDSGLPDIEIPTFVSSVRLLPPAELAPSPGPASPEPAVVTRATPRDNTGRLPAGTNSSINSSATTNSASTRPSIVKPSTAMPRSTASSSTSSSSSSASLSTRVTHDELVSLPSYLQSQFSVDQLNESLEAVGKIDFGNGLTEEQLAASVPSSVKIKSLLLALLKLNRLSSQRTGGQTLFTRK